MASTDQRAIVTLADGSIVTLAASAAFVVASTREPRGSRQALYANPHELVAGEASALVRGAWYGGGEEHAVRALAWLRWVTDELAREIEARKLGDWADS